MKPYISVIGNGELDKYYRIHRWPDHGEVIECRPVSSYVGGLLANAACVMAGYKTHKVYLLGYAGTDADGRFIRNSLSQCNVDLTYYKTHPDFKAIQCSVYLLNGDRTIFVSIPDETVPMRFTDEERKVLTGSSFIYTTMNRLMLYDNGMEVIKEARANGAKLCYDLESYEEDPSQDPYLALADIIFINDHDFKRLSGDLSESICCDRLLTMGASVICITKGKWGGTVYLNDRHFNYAPYLVQAIDATGAGDTFNGSFVHKLICGENPENAAQFAAAAAARAVTIQGPHGGIASEEEVYNFTVQHNH